MAEIDLDSIPVGMHVLSSMNCRAEGKGPSYHLFNKDIDQIILLGTGEIGVYHPNIATDSFHLITDLSMVEKVKYSPAEVVHPIRFHLLTMLSFLCSVFWLILALAVIYDFVLNFDDYFSYSSPDMTVKQTAQEAAMGAIFITIIAPVFALLYLPFLVKDRLGRWARQEKLEIQISENSKIVFFWEFPYERRLIVGKYAAWILAFAFSLLIIHADFLVFFIVLEVILLVVIIGAMIIKSATFDVTNDDIDSRGKGSINSMNNFHMSIETILGSESTDSGIISNRGSLEKRLGSRIKELKRRLEIHEEVLNNLTQRNWSMMLSAPVEYMGMAQIRRCVEKLLTPLVNKLGITIKPKDRGVRTLKNILVKNNTISSNALRDIEIIEAITNPAAHDFDTSEENYITSLTSFVNIVDWCAELLSDSSSEE